MSEINATKNVMKVKMYDILKVDATRMSEINATKNVMKVVVDENKTLMYASQIVTHLSQEEGLEIVIKSWWIEKH